MKAIITKLDHGYTVSVDNGQEKRRFAFENREGMLDYVHAVFPIEQPEPMQQAGEGQPDV